MRLYFDNMQNTLINTGPKNGGRSRAFIVVLFAIKPFIDLTWNIPLFSIGGVVLNPLRITGFCVFIIAGSLYFFQNDNKRIFNERIIWLFIGLNLFTSIIAIFFYNRPVMNVMDTLLRLFDAYFIYFIGHRYIENDRDKLRIISIIWITTLLVSILSTIQYFMGTFNIDITQGVVRFAGLYNDPGTPSYNAVISMVFGALYIEILRKQKRAVPLIVHIVFVLTLLVAAFVLKITVTKNALLMLIVFITMWFGLYKRKSYVVIPLLIICGYYIYSISEAIQARIAPELEFLAEGGRSMEEARHLGEGRVALWERLLIYYSQDFDPFQQLFGTFRSFGAHNQYIAYLMQVGVVGLTVFLIILLSFYRQLIYLYRKFRQPEVYMGIVLLTAFAVCALTGHPFGYTTLLWYLMILLSSVNVYACADTIGSDLTPYICSSHSRAV